MDFSSIVFVVLWVALMVWYISPHCIPYPRLMPPLAVACFLFAPNNVSMRLWTLLWFACLELICIALMLYVFLTLDKRTTLPSDALLFRTQMVVVFHIVAIVSCGFRAWGEIQNGYSLNKDL